MCQPARARDEAAARARPCAPYSGAPRVLGSRARRVASCGLQSPTWTSLFPSSTSRCISSSYRKLRRLFKTMHREGVSLSRWQLITWQRSSWRKPFGWQRPELLYTRVSIYAIYEPLRWILRRTPRPQAAFAWTQIRGILCDHELPWSVDLLEARARLVITQGGTTFWWRGQPSLPRPPQQSPIASGKGPFHSMTSALSTAAGSRGTGSCTTSTRSKLTTWTSWRSSSPPSTRWSTPRCCAPSSRWSASATPRLARAVGELALGHPRGHAGFHAARVVPRHEERPDPRHGAHL